MKVEQQYLSLPISVQFEITNSCNHKCPHCYILSDFNKSSVENVDDSTIIKIAEKIVENKIFNVIVTGGEPLLNKKNCKKIITIFKDNGINTALNTNLTLLDDEFISFLKKISIDSILTSCPASESNLYKEMVGVNRFDIFIRNLKKLNDARLKNTVNMVITKKNINDIYSTACILKQAGCKTFAATPMGFNMINPQNEMYLNKDDVRFVVSELIHINENLKMNVDIAEVIPKCIIPEDLLDKNYSFLNRKCSAGRKVAAISSNGDIRPCAHNMESYGNILQDDFSSVWIKMKDWRSNIYIPEKCKECTWINKCNGGCRTNAKVYSGNWNSEDPWMDIPILSPLSNKLAEKIKSNVKFSVCKDFKFRKEPNDLFLIINAKQHLLVNKTLFNLIMDLRKFDEIGINDIANRYKIETSNISFQDIMQYLVLKNILRIT